MAKVTKVDFRGAQRKLEKAKLALVKAGKASVHDIAVLGMAHAKGIAPYDTGNVAQSISISEGTNKDGPFSEVKAKWRNDGHSRSMGNFDLIKWMHATGGVGHPHYRGRNGKWYTNTKKPKVKVKVIKSGSPKFMYRTTEWLRRRKIPVAQGHFNKIKIR